MKTLIHALLGHWNYNVELHIAQKNDEGKLFVAQPVVFQEAPMGVATVPALTLPREAAQVLMDELWATGVRPTDGVGSAGAMAATQRHLQDMQEIAKGALKKAGLL